MNKPIMHNGIAIHVNEESPAQWVFDHCGKLQSFSTLEEAQQAIDAKRAKYPTQAFRNTKGHFWIICAIDGKFTKVHVTAGAYWDIRREQAAQ